MTRRLPPLAILLTVLGLIPFVACGFGAVWVREPLRAALLMGALVAYGAVILSFLGAVHWGLALADDTGLAERQRIGLGVLPALAGWVAMLAALLLQPIAALAILIAGFIAVIVVENRAAMRGIIGRRYVAMRWTASVVVIALLTAVLVIRLGGLHLRA